MIIIYYKIPLTYLLRDREIGQRTRNRFNAAENHFCQSERVKNLIVCLKNFIADSLTLLSWSFDFVVDSSLVSSIHWDEILLPYR